MSVEETKRVIRQGLHAAENAKRLLAAVHPLFADARDLTLYTTHDSQQQKVKDCRFLLEQAKEDIQAIGERVEIPIDGAKRYLDVLG